MPQKKPLTHLQASIRKRALATKTKESSARDLIASSLRESRKKYGRVKGAKGDARNQINQAKADYVSGAMGDRKFKGRFEAASRGH